MARIFWRKQQSTREWKLCTHPVATLMNVSHEADGWNITCLGQSLILNPKLSLEEVQAEAENMLERILRELLPALDECRQRPKGTNLLGTADR